MTETDQPRPDLDAAIDAALPSLTAVSDDMAAAALRRTRVALAARAGSRRVWGWESSLTATAIAGVTVIVTVALWRPAPAPDAIVERRPEAAPVATAPPATPAARVVSAPVAPKRAASGEPATPRPDGRRTRPVQATSVPVVVARGPRPDPLVALARALQEIPEEAWNESLTRAYGPVSIPDVAINPILVPELVTPPIPDPSADANAPGDL